MYNNNTALHPIKKGGEGKKYQINYSFNKSFN